MAKVTGPQDIPSGLQKGYSAALSTENMIDQPLRIKRRPPFHTAWLWGGREIRPPVPRGPKVSDAMMAQRHIFCECVRCFQRQPASGGVEPPDIGPRNRSWWYNAALEWGWWYFTYFMKKTLDLFTLDEGPDWCKILVTSMAFIDSLYPDQNWHDPGITIVRKDTVRTTYTLIKKPTGTGIYTTLHIKTYQVYPYYTYPFKVDAWKISDDWNASTVTWNTKPNIEAKLISRSFYEADNNKWFGFHVGNVKAVLLRIDLEQNGRVEFHGDTTVTIANRPYWT
jgi:hypothetical protein